MDPNSAYYHVQILGDRASFVRGDTKSNPYDSLMILAQAKIVEGKAEVVDDLKIRAYQNISGWDKFIDFFAGLLASFGFQTTAQKIDQAYDNILKKLPKNSDNSDEELDDHSSRNNSGHSKDRTPDSKQSSEGSPIKDKVQSNDVEKKKDSPKDSPIKDKDQSKRDYLAAVEKKRELVRAQEAEKPKFRDEKSEEEAKLKADKAELERFRNLEVKQKAAVTAENTFKYLQEKINSIGNDRVKIYVEIEAIEKLVGQLTEAEKKASYEYLAKVNHFEIAKHFAHLGRIEFYRIESTMLYYLNVTEENYRPFKFYIDKEIPFVDLKQTILEKIQVFEKAAEEVRNRAQDRARQEHEQQLETRMMSYHDTVSQRFSDSDNIKRAFGYLENIAAEINNDTDLEAAIAKIDAKLNEFSERLRPLARIHIIHGTNHSKIALHYASENTKKQLNLEGKIQEIRANIERGNTGRSRVEIEEMRFVDVKEMLMPILIAKEKIQKEAWIAADIERKKIERARGLEEETLRNARLTHFLGPHDRVQLTAAFLYTYKRVDDLDFYLNYLPSSKESPYRQNACTEIIFNCIKNLSDARKYAEFYKDDKKDVYATYGLYTLEESLETLKKLPHTEEFFKLLSEHKYEEAIKCEAGIFIPNSKIISQKEVSKKVSCVVNNRAVRHYMNTQDWTQARKYLKDIKYEEFPFKQEIDKLEREYLEELEYLKNTNKERVK